MLDVNDALRIGYIDVILVERIFYFRHGIVIDGNIIFAMDFWIGRNADGIIGKLFDADFHSACIEDTFIFFENIFENLNGFMMVVLVINVEDEGNEAVP